MTQQPSAIVIGAGLGGLSAAIQLAARGVSVRVLEAGDAAGGKVGAEAVDGIPFDTGPSLLTLPSVFEALFRSAGSNFRDEVTLLRHTPMFHYRWPDGTALTLGRGPEADVDEVQAQLGSRAAGEFRGFLRYVEQTWEAAAPHFVLEAAPSLSRILRGGGLPLAALRKIDPFHSMAGAISKRVQSRHLRDVLLRYATYNGSDPRRAPAALLCIAHVELGIGSFGVQGGIRSLIDALLRLASRLGVEIETGARVVHLRTRESAVHSVILADGRHFSPKAVVANADISHVTERLLPSHPRPLQNSRSDHSMSAFNMVVAVPTERQLAPHTVLFPERYLEEFEDVFDRQRIPRDPTVYACAQHVAHGNSGSGESGPLFVMVNAPAVKPALPAANGDASWAALRQQTFAQLRRHGLVEDGDPVLWQRVPAELAARFPNTGGALYGAAMHGPLSAFRRAGNRSRRWNNLYFASGSVHPGGGMPLCIQSGMLAAQALIEDQFA